MPIFGTSLIDVKVVQVFHYTIRALYWVLALWDDFGERLRHRFYTASLSLLQIGRCVRNGVRFLYSWLYIASKFRELRESVQPKLTKALRLPSGSLLKDVGVLHYSQIAVTCHDARRFLLNRLSKWLDVVFIYGKRARCSYTWCKYKVGLGRFENFFVLIGIKLLGSLQNLRQMVIHRELYLLERFFLMVQGAFKQVSIEKICLGLISTQFLLGHSSHV